MITTLFVHLGAPDDFSVSPSLWKTFLTIEPELRFVLITLPLYQRSFEKMGVCGPSECRVYNPSWTWKEKWRFIKDLRAFNPIYSFSLSLDLTSQVLSYMIGAYLRGIVLREEHLVRRVVAAYFFHHRVLIGAKLTDQSRHGEFVKLAGKMGLSFFK